MFEGLDWARRVERIEPRRGYPPREKWGEGAWQWEPDLVEWRDATGYALLIVRGPMGALCGYVGIPPEHPLHGKAYNDVEELVNVHGGLTFADACHEGGLICHRPWSGEADGVWWFGFDCNHYGDLDPAGRALMAEHGIPRGESHGTYRDLPQVRAEVESLAAQLKALATGACVSPPSPSP